MNGEFLILRSIYEEKTVSQRDIAKALDVSLGKVNQIFKDVEKKGLLTSKEHYKLTKSGKEFLDTNKINTAVILAAEQLLKTNKGVYLPIGLREIDGEPLIERNIKFLLEKNINRIYLVAGNLIEGYEYLIDKYNINFIYDEDYEKKSTLSKLLKVRNVCEENDAYILMSNTYTIKNIFHEYEIESFLYGQFMKNLEESLSLILNNKNVLIGVEDGGENTYAKTSIMFLKKDYSKDFFKLLRAYDKLPSANALSYEDALVRNLDILPDIYVYKIKEPIYIDIKRPVDFVIQDKSLIEQNKFPMSYVVENFDIEDNDVIDIDREESESDQKIFSFSIFRKEYENKRYVVKEIGEASKIDRDVSIEKKLYEELNDSEYFERVLFIDNEYRVIKEAFDGYRKIELEKDEDRKVALRTLRRMHNASIKIERTLDIEDMIDKYILVLNSNHIDVLYKDFKESIYIVKKLIYYLRGSKRPKVVCKNFISNYDLCYTSLGVKIQNIDTVALCDPFIDVAAIASYINFGYMEVMKIYDEYNNMLDIPNIAMQNTDKLMARNYIICYLAIQYFISAIKVLIRESMYMTKESDSGFRKYRKFKQCIDYIQKNKVI